MSNICHNCLYHEKCMAYRYNNIKTKDMEKITVKKNKDGKPVIFVEKCQKFTARMFKYYPKEIRDKKIKKISAKNIDKR